MRPVQVSIDVPQPREDVYDFLDVMANHAEFTSHMLRDWRFAGPSAGVGAKAHATAFAAGRMQGVDIEVIEAERPARTVERSVSANGQRVATGTYTLAGLPEGGTRVTFTYAWQQAPLGDRLIPPLTRAVARRGNQRAMQRLAERLSAQQLSA
jgi:hypothetical protein